MKAFHVLAVSAGMLTMNAMTMAAVVNLSQGFENDPFTDGTMITSSAIGDGSTSIGGWNTNSPGGISDPTRPIVTSEKSYSGNQSLKLIRSSYDNNGTTSEVNLEMVGRNTSGAVPVSGDVMTSFYVYMEPGVAFQFFANSSAGNDNPRMQFGRSALDSSNGSNFTISAYNNGTNKSVETISYVGNDGWYGIKVITHVGDGNYDIYLDGGSGFQKITSASLALPTGFNATDASQSVLFKPKGDYGTSFYLDDVQIAVPEPASAALLVLGGSALLLKRRRR